MPSSYELACTDCTFRTTVVGDLDAAMEAVEAHRRELGAGPSEHFVNVHRLDAP